MKFIPILFSTPMVQAILEGRKKQTRRVVNPQPVDCSETHKHYAEAEWKNDPFTPSKIGLQNGRLYCSLCGVGGIKSPYGQPGDILWVRETFRPIEQDFGLPRFEYKATETINLTDKWKPCIHMPKSACRIFLKVKSVRVERLQDISEEDAISEGVFYYGEESGDYKNYLYNDKYGDDWGVITAKESFQTLWESINGMQSWESNPFVWVIEFERIELTTEQRNQFLNS